MAATALGNRSPTCSSRVAGEDKRHHPVGLHAAKYDDAQGRNYDRLGVLHPVHRIRSAAVGLQVEGTIAAGAPYLSREPIHPDNSSRSSINPFGFSSTRRATSDRWSRSAFA
jgi:hypothetical protein